MWVRWPLLLLLFTGLSEFCRAQDRKNIVRLWSPADKGPKLSSRDTVFVDFEALENGVTLQQEQDQDLLLALELPMREDLVICAMRTSTTLSPSLRARFPDLITLAGDCVEGSKVELSFISNETDSLRATVSVSGIHNFVYLDSARADSIEYSLSLAIDEPSDRRDKSSSSDFSCQVKTLLKPPREDEAPQLRRLLEDMVDECSFVEIDMLSVGEESFVVANASHSMLAGESFVCPVVQEGWPIKRFAFTAPESSSYYFHTCNTVPIWDSVMQIRRGECDGHVLACNDDVFLVGTCSHIELDLAANQRVVIEVGTYNSTVVPDVILTVGTSIETFRSLKRFRLALVINRPLSVAFGGSSLKILNVLSAIVSRANAVYIRELGVFFELIGANTLLLCSNENMAIPAIASVCNKLPSDGNLLEWNRYFIEDVRGIPPSAYDIGQGLYLGGGGIAAVRSICVDGIKSAGASGFGSSQVTSAMVAVFCHELGHQLGAEHTFRDCGATDQYSSDPFQSVEPGSGSTIMSYAGVCPSDRNLQSTQDLYFHPVSLGVMQSFVRMQQRLLPDTCGSRELASPPKELAEISTPDPSQNRQSVCSVPIGNYFQLRGDAQLPNDSNALLFYQWDDIHPGRASFRDLNLTRFRSWRPTAMRSRYFPNLYYLTYDMHLSEPHSLAERLPLAPLKIQFRLLIRTEYDAVAIPALQATEETTGSVALRDIEVVFSSQDAPLLFDPATRNRLKTSGLFFDEEFILTWTPTAVKPSKVKILIASNTMPSRRNDFEYSRDVRELDWIELAALDNGGAAALTIPSRLADMLDGTNVSLMLRTFDDTAAFPDLCFAFDFVPGVTLSKPTFKPSKTPSTSKPSVGPSHTPTTSKPSRNPSRSPSRTPSRAPSRAPTPPQTSRPSLSPTEMPSASPTRKPTPIPTLPPALLAKASRCVPSAGLSQRACAKRVRSCSRLGIRMKWIKQQCLVNRVGQRDSGCRCGGYCGYVCASRCNADRECTWIGPAESGTCVNRLTGIPSSDPLRCGV